MLESIFINCLREEGVNIMAHPPHFARCDYWVNDSMKQMRNDLVMKNIGKEGFLINCSKGWKFV